ncbi:MAG: 4Fe-4S dicluster domain-containing protein, partial [Gammaproteobacteria bacterium]|nr:4Fe-4S dicluster domain-containing protein [Gammaproteobacteria bacterium]
MQTDLPAEFLATPEGERANAILRSCVHCGFCNATCPTYQVLGNELDGPRGRIYLIKEMLETQTPNAAVTTHLDRCLTCRACETTCPSGVRYGELLEIGREFLERRPGRGLFDRLVRWWLTRVVPHPEKLRRWLRAALPFERLAPRHLRAMLRRPPEPDAAAGTGEVLLLQGCVQRVMTP